MCFADFLGLLPGRGEGCAVCLGGHGWQGEFLLENKELGAFLDRGRAVSFFATSCLTSPIARGGSPNLSGSLSLLRSPSSSSWVLEPPAGHRTWDLIHPWTRSMGPLCTAKAGCPWTTNGSLMMRMVFRTVPIRSRLETGVGFKKFFW